MAFYDVFKVKDDAYLKSFITKAESLSLVAVQEDGVPIDVITPFVFHAELGVFDMHIAKANPILKSLKQGSQVLLCLDGVRGYVSPTYYVDTPMDKTAPTLNYAAVRVTGAVKLIQDSDWLNTHLSDLVKKYESQKGWSLNDLPDQARDNFQKMIIGVQIKAEKIEGMFKLNQNKTQDDINSVIDNFQTQGHVLGDFMKEFYKNVRS